MFIFVGYGKIQQYKTSNPIWKDFVEGFIYLPMKTLKREIDKRGKTLKTANIDNIFSEFFQCKPRPKILLEDLGELYQSDTFEGLEVTHEWLPEETFKYRFEKLPVPQKAKIKKTKEVSMELIQDVPPSTFETAIEVSEGLIQQIPGRAYKEKNTEEIYVFLGYETKALFGGLGQDWLVNPKYLYVRLEDLNREVKDGGLVFNPTFEMKGVYIYWNIRHTSKPKMFVEDIGKVFDEKLFKNFHFNDGTFEMFIGGNVCNYPI